MNTENEVVELETTTKPPSILIVDDEAANLAVMREALEADYSLAFATSGALGLTAARQLKPDLILLDVQMPDMDGLSVCHQLKSDPDLAGIPVIFVTILSALPDERDGFAAGAVDYIAKPISIAILQARVKTHLNLVQARREHAEIEKLKIYRAMARSTQHVLNNYLNKMNLFLMLAEETEGFPHDELQVIKDCSNEAQALVQQLTELKRIDEQSILQSVAPVERAASCLAK
ncbi:response regulator [Rhabdochromatium marinum]|uniref:response regulator n=1 Tax=Rhabdochromatium marinum TaxID=48729 RepID=UPI001905C283|nr:response regulator [Rhabdochromatium marinum]MBK1650067.1 hypothetical protein [Rhabdochromatium marinum]